VRRPRSCPRHDVHALREDVIWLELGSTDESYLLDFDISVMETTMGFGRGLLLWLLGIPLPIIILLALFWHH
jgi:hypothetical protein